MTDYKYPPLQPGQIRLLHLEPGTSDEIHCTLQNVSLDTGPDYEALSYRWQDSRMTERIVVGRQSQLSLTKSLFHALRDLRSSTGSKARVVWADGICINQNDVSERSEQVQRMDLIYSEARRVVTYIGEGDGSTPVAIELAEKMLQLPVPTNSEPETDIDVKTRHQRQCAQLGIEDFPVGLTDDDHPDPAVRGLQSMFDAPWSRRLWIIQESLLNDNMVMMCGRFEMPWTMLFDVASLIVSRKMPRIVRFAQWGNPDSAGGSAKAMRRIGSLRRDFKRMSPLSIMQATNQMLCSDPRDKLYGLMGIFRFKHGCQHPRAHDPLYEIEADYRKSVAEVYADSARYFLSQITSLRLFATICSEPTIAGLPSWVPDWTHQEELFQLSSREANRACGGTKRFLEFDVSASRITLSGVCIDHISYVSQEFTRSLERADGNISDRWAGWYSEHLSRIQNSDKYADKIDAVFRTLTANILEENAPGVRESSAEAMGGILRMINFMARGLGKGPVTIPGVEECESRKEYYLDVTKRTGGRSFCMTENGYCGLVPARSRAGDFVAVVRGGKVPLVFRERGGEVLLMGEAYVHGFMGGEAVDGGGFRDPYQERKFVVV